MTLKSTAFYGNNTVHVIYCHFDLVFIKSFGIASMSRKLFECTLLTV